MERDRHLDESERTLNAALLQAARDQPELRDELLRLWLNDQKNALCKNILENYMDFSCLRP